MADLSQVNPRVARQDRPTTRTDNVLPRRDTEAGQRTVFADMRTARRGDGGAEELMRVLNGVTRAAGNIQDTANNAFKVNEQKNAVQGAQDFMAGKVDPVLEKKSYAYREALSSGQAQKDTFTFVEQLQQDLTNALDDPNNEMDPAEADAFIAERIKGFFAGPDGKVKDFGSDKANALVTQTLMRAEAELRGNARKVIVDQVNKRGSENAANAYVLGIKSGQDIGFETAMSMIPPGVDRQVAKATLLDAASAHALSIEETNPDQALATYDSILNSKRPDGTPSLSSKEREALVVQRREAGRRIEAFKERQKNELQEQNKDKYLERLAGVPGSGPPVTRRELLQGMKDGTIDDGWGYSMIQHMDNEAEAAARRARRGTGESVGSANSGLVGNLIASVYSGEITAGQASALAGNLLRSGALGSGRSAYKNLTELRKVVGVTKFLGKQQMGEITQMGKDFTDTLEPLASQIPDIRFRAKFKKDVKELHGKIINDAARDILKDPGQDHLGKAEERFNRALATAARYYGVRLRK